MIKYHFKVAQRVFGRNTFSSLINIFSIAVGMTAFMLVFLWVRYELSFDDFNSKKENIYRVTCEGKIFENNIKDATSGAILSKALPGTFPEVKDAAALLDFGTSMMSMPEGDGFRMKVFGATASVFNIFTFPVIQGDPRSFDQPNTAFITVSAAKRLYGEENPVGKILSTGMDRENKQFTITGIIADIPENSHFTFDFLFSLPSISFYRNATNDWMNANVFTYLLLDENADYKAFETKLNDFLQEQIGPILKQWRNLSLAEWKANGESWRFVLQPLSKIHLYSLLKNEAGQNGNITYIYMASIIGLFILIISIINFANLSTVHSISRGKEIMVKKVLGASKKSLRRQFLVESILKSYLALIVSVFFIPLIVPVLEEKIGIKIFSDAIITPSMYIWLILFPVITGVIAGLYPAFVVSGMAPLKTMAVNYSERPGPKLLLKDALLVMQFTISVLVIISTITVSRQLNFLQNEKLGFKKENILIIRQMEDMSRSQQSTFKEKLLGNSKIKTASFSHRIPGMNLPARTLAMAGESDLQLFMLEVCPVEPSFFSTYRIELKEGNFFDEETKNTRKILLNECAIKTYNIKEPVGKRLYYTETEFYEIAGVLKDFHYNSKRKEIQAAAFVQEPDVEFFWSPEYLSLGIEGTGNQDLINWIKEEYHKVIPGKEFVYSFFDEDYDALYKNELQTKQLYSLFSLIAICLSCLGLFGLVNYILMTKIKEIGIRKINGATTTSIFTILSGGYIRWILIAFIIAAPTAYFIMNRWLENFAYRINLDWWIFIIAGLLAMVTALLTVSWQSWRAAIRNPVEALRYE